MADLPETFLVHRARVRAIVGHSADGEEYAEEIDIPCFISHKRRLTRSAGGEEVVSEATVRAPAAFAARIAPEAEIVLHTERETPDEPSTVITSALNDDGGFGAWQHLRLDIA